MEDFRDSLHEHEWVPVKALLFPHVAPIHEDELDEIVRAVTLSTEQIRKARPQHTWPGNKDFIHV